MSKLLAQVVRFFRAPQTDASPALALMEAADSLAGLDAYQAQQLRAASMAWLRVVR